MNKKVIIIGAGPAGLTSGLILARNGFSVQVYESDPEYVGGLSKTVRHKGFRIDIGGHRLYSKDAEVQKFWQEILKENLLVRKRMSRIFYKKRFLKYPIKPLDILLKVSPFESGSFLLSYLKSRLTFRKKLHNFENWIIANFGEKLYKAFFKSYTEKVWGMDCTEISSDWAVQRINNLNILTLLKSFALECVGLKDKQIKSLIDEFEYPIYGPGMLWETVKKEIEALGGQVILGKKVQETYFDEAKSQWSIQLNDGTQSICGDHLISTAPLKEFIQNIKSPKVDAVRNDLNDFRHRAFITIAIMFKGKNGFPDNWIYINDDRVKVGRIQNYGNWSPHMVPGPEFVSYGMEYFCEKGDELWSKPDQEFFNLALKELEVLQLPFSKDELDFKIIRCANAYPVYDLGYAERLTKIKKFTDQFSNLHLIGRSGLHRYNNQDHSIKTAMVVCENILLNEKKFDPWNINQDAQYLEKVTG
jgi:protoporphyrinogen oxidase